MSWLRALCQKLRPGGPGTGSRGQAGDHPLKRDSQGSGHGS
jgi:hypothetical protein